MISSLRGTVLAASNGSAVVEVGGVGYAVAATPQLVLGLRVGAEALIHTALIVREDDLSLYGFASRDELAVFDLLRGVTGVGPKSARGVLAAMSPSEIAAAVAAEDDAAFRRVSGIGPKTAKLIVVSLAGKLMAFSAPAPTPGTARSQGSAGAQARIALEGLGFPEKRVREVVDDLVATTTDLPAQELIRNALAVLGPAGVR